MVSLKTKFSVVNLFIFVSVLQYEPNNATAKEFYPLILEKLQLSKFIELSLYKLYLYHIKLILESRS